VACENKDGVIFYNPMNNTNGILHGSQVYIDTRNSTDGSGSIRVDSRSSRTLDLFETGDIDIQGTTLIYEADLKAQGLNGQVFLELRCTFADGEETFKHGLDDPLTGTREWNTQRVEIRLRRKENPTNIKLSVVVDALGTFWIDNVRLSREG